MEEQGGGWLWWCKPEWQVISGAPRLFGTSVLAISILIVVGTWWMFHENLSMKNDLIASLKEENLRLKQEDNKSETSESMSAEVQPSSCNLTKAPTGEQETIRPRTYMNETVELDGKTFDRVRFVNTTLMFHGSGPVTFLEAKFQGTTHLVTDNWAAKSFLSLLEKMKNSPAVTKVFIGEKNIETGEIKVFSTITKQDEKNKPPSGPKGQH